MPQPLKDIWVIGEGFLRSSFGTLQTLRTEVSDDNSKGKHGNHSIPYIYQQYKVKPFYQASSGSATWTLYKLFNSLVGALNKESKLPEYILMLPDRHIILDINYYRPGIGFIIDRAMSWLGKQLDRAISIK